MNKFKGFWKSHFGENIMEERIGAMEYREMALDAKNPMNRSTLRQMATDEERHAEMLEDMETENQYKSIVEKPGNSIHSAKWDRCIEHVKESGSGKNAYAVCTAMMGEESFKSIEDDATFMAKMDEYMTTLGIKMKQKSVGTDFAGKVPSSLLARQDLETTKSCTFAIWYYDKCGNRLCAVFNNAIDSEAFIRDLMSMGYQEKDIAIMTKGVVEQTGKKLKDEAEKAKDADTKTEVKSVIDTIKEVQLRRQTATIQARDKAVGKDRKSFKDVWNSNKK